MDQLSPLVTVLAEVTNADVVRPAEKASLWLAMDRISPLVTVLAEVNNAGRQELNLHAFRRLGLSQVCIPFHHAPAAKGCFFRKVVVRFSDVSKA